MAMLSRPQELINDLWQLPKKWRRLNPKVIDRFSYDLESEVSKIIIDSAETDVAEARIADMQMAVERRIDSSTKNLITIGAILISAFTFSAGSSILTSRLGALGLPAAIVMSALGGAVVEKRATKVLAGQKIRREAEKQQTVLAQRVSNPVNKLDQNFYRTKQQVVTDEEATYLQKDLPIDAILALGLSTAEYGVGFWIVSQMALPGGILVGGVVALIPIGLLWGTAAFLSEVDTLPEHYEKLIYKYEKYLQPGVDLEDKELQQWLSQKDAREAKLDYLIKFLAEGEPSGSIQNLNQAELAYEVRLLRESKKRVERERHDTIEELVSRRRKAIENLPNLYSVPEIDLAGKTPQEIDLRQQEIEKEKYRWVKEQTDIVNQEYTEKIEMAVERYATLIRQLDQDIEQGLTDI